MTEEIESIRQTGTIFDYCIVFQDWFKRVQISEGFSDFYGVYLFICGLEPRIWDVFASWHQYSCNTVDEVISLALKIDDNGLRDSFSPFDPESSFYNKDLEWDTTITLDELMKDNEFFKSGNIEKVCEEDLVQEISKEDVNVQELFDDNNSKGPEKDDKNEMKSENMDNAHKVFDEMPGRGSDEIQVQLSVKSEVGNFLSGLRENVIVMNLGIIRMDIGSFGWKPGWISFVRDSKEVQAVLSSVVINRPATGDVLRGKFGSLSHNVCITNSHGEVMDFHSFGEIMYLGDFWGQKALKEGVVGMGMVMDNFGWKPGWIHCLNVVVTLEIVNESEMVKSIEEVSNDVVSIVTRIGLLSKNDMVKMTDILENATDARAYNTDHQPKLLLEAASMMVETRFTLMIVDHATASYRTDLAGQGKEDSLGLPKLPHGWYLKPKKELDIRVFTLTRFESLVSTSEQSYDSRNDHGDEEDDGDDDSEAFMNAFDTLSRGDLSFYNCSVSSVIGVGSEVKQFGIQPDDPKLSEFRTGRFTLAAKVMVADVCQHAIKKLAIKEKPRSVKKVVVMRGGLMHSGIATALHQHKVVEDLTVVVASFYQNKGSFQINAAELFVGNSEMTPEVMDNLKEAGVKLRPYESIFSELGSLTARGVHLWLDTASVNADMETACVEYLESVGSKSKGKKLSGAPSVLCKSSLTDELKGMCKSHLGGVAALTQFCSWTWKEMPKNVIFTEVEVGDKLFEFCDLQAEKETKFRSMYTSGSASYIDGTRHSRPKKLKAYTHYVQNLKGEMAVDIVMLPLRTLKGLELKCFMGNFGSPVTLKFGLARVFFTLPTLPLWYNAIEVLLGAIHYSTITEIWSVGCTCDKVVSKTAIFAEGVCFPDFDF